MNKFEALTEALPIVCPNIFEILKVFQKHNPSKDFSYGNFLRILSKKSYNLAHELGISASTTTKLSKQILIGRGDTNSKICGKILGEVGLKICSACDTVKTFEEFRANAGKAYGLNGYCKECHMLGTKLTQTYRQSNYRAQKLSASPKWADADRVMNIYNNCPEGMHVDHIVPLQHELVCGLHNEFNLQYLSERENCSKNNKYDVC